jgi:hypothetical protein
MDLLLLVMLLTTCSHSGNKHWKIAIIHIEGHQHLLVNRFKYDYQHTKRPASLFPAQVGFVFQCAQHPVTQFAERGKVLFPEDSVFDNPDADGNPNLLLIGPRKEDDRIEGKFFFGFDQR